MTGLIADVLPRTGAAFDEGLRGGWQLGAQLYVSRHGRVVIDAAIGQARRGVSMAADTVNVWFSSGKPLTAVALARLWERRRIDLDTPVAGVIPEFGVGGKERIRVRHLLDHTAGFRSADRLCADRAWDWDGAIAAICAAPADAGWIPGERAGYQLFSSWYILGEIIRRLDGRMIDRHVDEEIFGPLGMRDCWMGLPAQRFRAYGERLGIVHVVARGRDGLFEHPVWNSESGAATISPGSNVRGPIRELGKFYEGLLGLRSARHESGAAAGGRLLGASTVAEFTRRHRVGLHDETFRHVMDWGLGFVVNSNRYGVETVPYGFGRHASELAFGHGGSQSSCGFADPDHGLVVAWFCNGMIGEPAHQRRARQINSAIYEDLGLVG